MLALFITIRPLTVLFHELGHAIPVMLMTGKGADIYIGSYADVPRHIRIPCGKLNIFLTPNPLFWQKGLCKPPDKKLSTTQQIIFVLGGPLLSLLIAMAIFMYAFYFDAHGLLKTIGVFALGSTLFDFCANLIPRTFATKNGRKLRTDGGIIFDLLKRKRYPQFQMGIEAFEEGKYAEAATLFQSCIDKGFTTEDPYRSTWYAWIFAKEYDKAYSAFQTFHNKFHLDSDDWYNAGIMYMGLNMIEEQLKAYQNAVALNPRHVLALNNIGYVLNTQNKFEEAIPYLDKAIESAPEFAYAYNNRGLAKI